jgi:hypothetical protein
MLSLLCEQRSRTVLRLKPYITCPGAEDGLSTMMLPLQDHVIHPI